MLPKQEETAALATIPANEPTSGFYGVLAHMNADTGEDEVQLVDFSTEQEGYASTIVVSGLYDSLSESSALRRGLDIRDIKSVSSSLRELIWVDPTDRGGIINEIYKAARDVAIIRGWLRLSSDLGTAGLTVGCVDDDREKFCKDLAYYLDWYAFDYKLQYHLTLADAAYVWWRYYDGGDERSAFAPDESYVPQWIEVLSPSAIAFNSLGKVCVKAAQFEPLRTIAVKDPQRRTAEERKYLKKFPKELVARARGSSSLFNDDLYPLEGLEEDGRFGYSVIEHPSKGSWEKWPVPKLYTSLADLKYIQMCMDIDFSAAYQMKAGIVIWSIGPDKPDASNPGPRKPALQTLESNVRSAISDKMPNIFSGNDLNVRWVIPPTDIFMQDKYNAALQRVMDILGVPAVFYPVGYTGAGEQSRSYAASIVTVKPYRQSIETTRRTTGMFGSKFFTELCRVNKIGDDDARVLLKYDPNVLMEDRALLQKAQLATQQGLASNQTALGLLEMDYALELSRKLEELEESDEEPRVFAPHYSPTRGSSPGEHVGGPNTPGGGRPTSKEGSTPEEGQPRPGVSVASVTVEEDPYVVLENIDFAEESIWTVLSEVDAVASSVKDEGFAIEVTEGYIRIPMSRGSFDKYRMGSMNKSGIRFLYGIKKGVSKIATVLFSKKKWTLKRAKKWVSSHKKKGD
jgi:hypothetical protein